MSEQPLILAINPGSTSTKFAVYLGEELQFKETVRHRDAELLAFPTVASQMDYRLSDMQKSFEQRGLLLQDLAAIVGRGGFLKPLASGTYQVGEAMLDDLRSARYGEHGSNLGALLAHSLAESNRIPAFIVDPVVVDEMLPTSRLSGIPDIERKSHVHALNIKAVSRKVANRIGKPHDECNFVVAHLGGGISVAAHGKGRILDVNNANNEGPFSPERAGGLPASQLVKLCYAGTYTEKQLLSKMTREGGLYAYLGTKDAGEAERLMEQGDANAKLVLDSMIQQIAKEIGAMATVMEGVVDAVILTGGMAFSEYITQQLSRKVKFIAPVHIIPGEEELEALAYGALRVIMGNEQAKRYE